MSRKRGLRKGPAPGFTLLELLMVLAVLALLAGLLFPSLAATRERGRQSVCSANLHQIGLAVRMYLDDYEGKPPRFQALADAGYLRSEGVLLCPDDPVGNWGGLDTDGVRGPEAPPETVRYSYLHPFRYDWPDWEWQSLISQGETAGIAACQLHGRRTAVSFFTLSYEGMVLRLQLDGAVVRRHVQWERFPGGITVANPWYLFSDSPFPQSRRPSS